MEVMFTIFTAFKLVENIIRKWTETLCTYKALSVPQLSIRIDDLLLGFKAVPAPSAGHGPQRHDVKT